MKLLKADPDKVTVEIAPGEILLLVAAIAEGSPPSGLDAEANELFHSLLDIHRATLEAEERAGPPFSVGDEVLVSLKIVGLAPSLKDGEAVTIVSAHPEDDTRDYAWCVVRRAHGEELDLPQFAVRRRD